jgi:hypothetical protein
LRWLFSKHGRGEPVSQGRERSLEGLGVAFGRRSEVLEEFDGVQDGELRSVPVELLARLGVGSLEVEEVLVAGDQVEGAGVDGEVQIGLVLGVARGSR